jgi:very-short-patch-repair endonuclease
VENEVEEALKIARDIASGEALSQPELNEASLPSQPTVGIVSFMRDQRDQLRERLTRPENAELSSKLDLLIGTPEEFQGNERDIIILTFGLGANMERYSRNFFENPNRFNVATSRARHFTYAILGGCPANAILLREYFGRFGYGITTPGVAETRAEPNPGLRGYRFAPLNLDRLESEFERLIMEELQEYASKRLQMGKSQVTLHNQVEACGQKRLDFVVFNTATKCCVAVEVDGPSHYCSDNHTLTDAHLERCAILRRAGWNIIHVEHHAWYKSGWLRRNEQLNEVRAKLHADLDRELG